MKLIYGDALYEDCDALCVTTNGFVTKAGKGVMGRGIAKEIADMFPNAPRILGAHILKHGNCVGHLFSANDTDVLAFPTKPIFVINDGTNVVSQAINLYKIGASVPGFHAKSTLETIAKSCIELKDYADVMGYQKVVVPRPGCNNGELTWEQVEPILSKYLDDRFHIITY